MSTSAGLTPLVDGTPWRIRHVGPSNVGSSVLYISAQGATSGTITVTIEGVSVTLAYNATQAQVLAALQAMSVFSGMTLSVGPNSAANLTAGNVTTSVPRVLGVVSYDLSNAPNSSTSAGASAINTYTGTQVGGSYFAPQWLEMGRTGQERLVQGTLTRRLNDSSEGSSITLPSRFAEIQTIVDGIEPDEQVHFLEFYRGDELRDVINVISSERTPDHVKFSGGNGLELLKKVFEQGRSYCHAPRDIIEICSRARQMVVAEDASGANPSWSSLGAGGYYLYQHWGWQQIGITTSGSPTGGTLTITIAFSDAPTSRYTFTVPYNGDGSSVYSGLVALAPRVAGWGPNVSGGTFPTTAVLGFHSQNAPGICYLNVTASLTGGTSPSVSYGTTGTGTTACVNAPSGVGGQSNVYTAGQGQFIGFDGSCKAGSIVLPISGAGPTNSYADQYHWRYSVTLDNFIPSNASNSGNTTLTLLNVRPSLAPIGYDVVTGFSVIVPEPNNAPVQPYAAWNDTIATTIAPVATSVVGQGQSAVNWPNGPLTLTLERQGRWMRAFVNGVPLPEREIQSDGTMGSMLLIYSISGGSVDTNSYASFTLSEASLVSLKPLLMRDSTRGGDLVLPGSYPTGGLSAQWWQNGDLSGSSAALYLMNSPTRETIPQNPVTQIDAQPQGFVWNKPTLGNPGYNSGTPASAANYSASYASVRYSGAIYVPADIVAANGGTFQMKFTFAATGMPFRLWVGKTQYAAIGLNATALVDSWYGGIGSNPTTVTIGSANVGTKAGWVPIIIECASIAGSGTSFTWQVNFPGSGTFTAPDGSSFTLGSFQTVNGSILSPLGIHRETIQGQSHYQIIQNMLTTYGLQLQVAPAQLESGYFPCQLIPTSRVGTDSGLQLTLGDRRDAEPAINPVVTTDATDQVHRLMGQSGIQQVSANVAGEVTDLSAFRRSIDVFPLFVTEGWSDHSEVSGTGISLLGALLAGELNLRTDPWQQVQAVPRGLERWAQPWPLTGALARIRWNPGDGLRLNFPELGVVDSTPRQILQVTETFNPNGLESMTVDWRQRPLNSAYRLTKAVRSLQRGLRVNSQQVIALPGQYMIEVLNGTTTGTQCIVPMRPGDVIRRAYIRITTNKAYSNNLPPGGTLDVQVSGVNSGFAFADASGSIDVTRFVQTGKTSFDHRFVYNIRNTSATACIVEHQAFVEVVR
jgi:hypothetical protein